jgi:hypothetical protein
VLDHVEVGACGVGIDVLAGCYDVDFSNIRIGAGSSPTYTPQVGLRIAGSAGSIRGQNISIWGYQDGVLLQDGAGELLFNELTIWGARQHCLHVEAGTYDVYVTNFRIGAGSTEQSGTYPDVLIRLATSLSGPITRIHFVSGKFEYNPTYHATAAVRLEKTAAGVTGPIRFDHCEFVGYPTVFSVTGDWDYAVRNSGSYVTENGGAATNVADGGTISHGLAATPTFVQVTPTVAGEMASVTAVGASNFTVAIKNRYGNPGTPQTIYWRAWV